VRTIEGLEDDPLIARLRVAFTEEHALQCGYCTPGMLVTARDIVLRLPGADEARIRLELAGNLCRCTGYAGIVRAVRRVLAEGMPIQSAEPPASPVPLAFDAPPVSVATHMRDGTGTSQTLRLAVPVDRVWDAIQDPRLVAECLPGARLTELAGGRLRGEVRASLGPIETLFSGEGRISFHDADRRAEIEGEGRDSRTGTRLNARVVLRLVEPGPAATDAVVSTDYTLQGTLAQFARGPVVQEFAAAIAATFAANLEARLSGGRPSTQRRLSLGMLMLNALWRRLRATLRLG
jgi:aerobic carbon-monoxide dehydrogenase small subunit